LIITEGRGIPDMKSKLNMKLKQNIKLKHKKILPVMLSLVLLLGVVGCSEETVISGGDSDDIITTTAVDQNKTMITVRVEFGAGQQENLEEILEKKFPDVDIVLRHDGSTSSTYSIKADLEAGVECDLIFSRKLPAVSDIAEEYLYDLSSEDFVDNYYMNSVDSCMTSEGRLCYLPGPSDTYGIVYDKTLFEENGWEVPNSYSEFLQLINTISQSDAAQNGDLVPIQASIMYPDMFQILFNTYGFDDVFAGQDNFTWLSNYQVGNGSMVGHMESAVEDFKKLFDDGILSVDDLEVTPTQRSEMMYQTHTTAMIIECQNAVNYNQLQNADDESNMHEIAMMPFWTSDEEDSDYLYAIPSYYMAINKASTEESEKKKEILLDIFEYLSSVEGQAVLIDDNFQLSSIEGVPVNSNSFSENIIDTVSRGQLISTFYYADSETDKQVERQLLGTLGDMLNGNITQDEWLTGADEVRDKYLSGELSAEEAYGQVTSTLTRLETAYTVAKMYSELTSAPIGICLGGGWSRSTNGYLYEGDITDSSLSCINPDKEQGEDDLPSDNQIVTSYLTGQQILDILNSSQSQVTTKGLSTYYVAYGLKVEYDPWAKDGEKVKSCYLSDGEELDLDKSYEVAYYNGSINLATCLENGEDLELNQIVDMTWQEAFLKWLDENEGGEISKPEMTITLEYGVSE
jgi:ABC-type glycerol-3-phosphate transport system substrate-binding protein